MKKLISFNYLATLVLALGIMVAFDSCTEDPCKDITCVNGSTVTVGDQCSCECDAGYEGSSCETLVRTKYLGNYNGSEVCGTDTFSIAITVSAEPSEDISVDIRNLYDAGFFTDGNVQTDGSISIPNQSFGTGTISGSIVFNADGKLEASYVIATSTGTSSSCTFMED